MLPISDVHFAFCGIATVAATLGYACARRAVFALASPSEPSKANVEAGQPEERSLKRKLDDADEHDVDPEEQSRPIKRNKTPPADQHESDEDLNQEWEVIVAPPPSYEQAVGLQRSEDDNSASPSENLPTVEQVVAPVEKHAPPTLPESLAEKVKIRRCSTPEPPTANPSPNEPETPPARPVTPPKPAATTNAFSAFSGSSSPFASYSKPSGASPFALSGQTVRTAPAWRGDNDADSGVSGRASSLNALAPSPNDTVSPATTTPSTLSQNRNALEVPKDTQPIAKPSSPGVTGEEDENVEAELKGVKFFVKRGQREFTDGIYGHVKILAQKSTPLEVGDIDPQETGAETNSRTRLLFRRDPLGQVSMNVGLRPTVRCHFDSAENILRIILMQQTTADGKGSKEDVVVYALKPGRSQKTDFQSFAKTLCDHEGLKGRAVTSSAAPASGDTTAS